MHILVGTKTGTGPGTCQGSLCRPQVNRRRIRRKCGWSCHCGFFGIENKRLFALTVRLGPAERNVRPDGPSGHRKRGRRLGGEPGAVRHMRTGRAGSSAYAFGRYSPRSMKAWSRRETQNAKTPTRQLVALPADPVYCRATPHDILPFSGDRSRPDPAARPRRPASPRHIRAAHRRPDTLGRESPAAATAPDPRQPRLASSRSCAARRRADRPENVPPRPTPVPA